MSDYHGIPGVDVRKKFPFHFCSTVVLQCECTSNYSVKSLLHSRLACHFTVSIFLSAYSRCSLCPMLLYLGYVLGPGSLSLLVCVWCPQLLQNWIYSDSVINHCWKPAHQTKVLGTSISLERFADFYQPAVRGWLVLRLLCGFHVCMYIYVYVCASALITCAIIISCTLLPCDLTLVEFCNLDSCFA